MSGVKAAVAASRAPGGMAVIKVGADRLNILEPAGYQTWKEEIPMIVSVISGKGGTGKTFIATNLVQTIDNKSKVQFLDCDVEEPNAHLFLKPELNSSRPVTIPVPEVDEEKCTYCGLCAEVCAFNALMVAESKVLVFEQLCHGCGGCAYFCPEGAITEFDRPIGVLETGRTGEIQFGHGRLEPGEALSPPLIEAVKEEINPNYLTIVDAPPGNSCSAVETVKGSDYCLLVTEPTPFGLHDLKLAVELIKIMKIPAGVVINRYLENSDNRSIEEYCEREGLPVLLKIPFDRDLASCYARGELVVEHFTPWRQVFADLGKRVIEDGGGNIDE